MNNLHFNGTHFTYNGIPTNKRTMKLLIKITKEVYEKTMYCGDSLETRMNNCAIAYAVREIFPDALIYQGIYLSKDEWFNEDNEPDIHLPEKAFNLIREFDRSPPETRLQMEPIEFEIEVPQEVIDKIGLQEIETILTKSKTLERVLTP